MSDTNRENDPMDEFLSTLGDEPQETKVLRVPEVIPTIQDDAANTESNAGPDGQTPREGSDAEAYAALKAKRAERRRKKLMRRGIVIGVAAAVIGGGAIAINILGKEPEQTMEAVTDFAVQGDFETIVDAKGPLQPLSATVITPEVGGQIESVNVVAGQTVKEGDVLMTIKNPELDRAVAEADRALRQARADLAAAQQALAEAKQLASQPTADRALRQARADLAAAQQALAEAKQLASQPTADPMAGPAGDVAGAQQAVNAAQVAVESAQASYNDAAAKAALRTVKAPAAGSIVSMNAQVGAQQAVNAAQVAVESAQASYNDAAAKAALRTVKAPAAGSIVSMNAQVGADLGESLGQVAVESAQASYNDAAAKAALRTVKAPAAGSIVSMNAQVGADLGESLGGAGTNGPLMQIADLSKMKVTIQVEEEDIASVAVDQTATISCPAFPDLSMTGRVTGIASIASGDGAQSRS